MRYYTIDNDNDIIVWPTEEEARGNLASGSEIFASREDFEFMTSKWPGERLLEIYNGLTGTIPVKKFENRKIALRRIWTAAQGLTLPDETKTIPATEPETKEVEAVKNKGKKAAKAAKAKPVKEKASKGTRKRRKAPGEAPVAAGAAKKGTILEKVVALLKRKAGASLDELMTETGWQKHSIRAFVTATVPKKLGVEVESFKDESNDGARTYRIAA